MGRYDQWGKAPLSNLWIESSGIVVLAIGSSIMFTQYLSLLRHSRQIELEFDVATGAFEEVIEQYFDHWNLTEAERDVARLAIKGVPIPDIAVMHHTREGTIKAQNSAIYRKAGVSGRAELIALFIEELSAGLAPRGLRGRTLGRTPVRTGDFSVAH